MNSERPLLPAEARSERAARIASVFVLLGWISDLAAVATSLWALYLVFDSKGFWAALVAFVFLSLCYKVGTAPMFAVSASLLCFYFHVVDVWLPIASYILAIGTLCATIALRVWAQGVEKPPASEDADRLVLEMMLAEPSAIAEIDRITDMLDDEIRQGRFNRERAEQLWLFMVDNCAHRYFSSIGLQASIAFPKTIRKTFAAELAMTYVRSHGNIASQRPARWGLAALLLGK